MRSRASVVAGVAVVGAMALSGCYGSTEPATDVGVNSATFNGKGTTNNGPADVWFQFWPTAAPGAIGSTGALAKRIPGGATGPIADKNVGIFGGLEPATQYAFQMCGKDVSAAQSVCAQTRTLTTVRPAGDVVKGSYSEARGVSYGRYDAHSDPSGAHPGGTVTITNSGVGNYTGHVTCLAVHGRDAAVGSVGTSDSGIVYSDLLEMRDGGIEHTGELDGGDLFGGRTSQGSIPPNCGAATFDDLGADGFRIDDIAVYDAP